MCITNAVLAEYKRGDGLNAEVEYEYHKQMVFNYTLFRAALARYIRKHADEDMLHQFFMCYELFTNTMGVKHFDLSAVRTLDDVIDKVVLPHYDNPRERLRELEDEFMRDGCWHYGLSKEDRLELAGYMDRQLLLDIGESAIKSLPVQEEQVLEEK